MKNASIDLEPIYKLRKQFTVLGLTGRTGSGCTTIADQLTKGFCSDYPSWETFKLNHNSYRKYRIIYEYTKKNFESFKIIEYKYVLLFFIVRTPLDQLIRFLNSKTLVDSFSESHIIGVDFKTEIDTLRTHSGFYERVHEKAHAIKIGFDEAKSDSNLHRLNELFFHDDEFRALCDLIDRILGDASFVKRAKFFQSVANNLRITSNPYKNKTNKPLIRVFTIVEVINLIIKGYRNECRQANRRVQIVIDSLRNPLEILFFKQRYSAFYMIAVNREQPDRVASLQRKYGAEFETMQTILKEEYDGAKQGEFFRQNVADCIQKADIHMSVMSNEAIETFNADLEKVKEDGEKVDNTTPKFSWQMQLLKYLALIFQPGLVPPSPEERCMQVAYAAKCNSGCISRQVGAAVTDEYYSVKTIGWNNTPGGQVPCILRNANDLLEAKGDRDIAAFTPFERNEPNDTESNEFTQALTDNFTGFETDAIDNLRGRNVCFCFKSLKNSCSEGKNQVHTRSLHAEEHAFLQITKFGGEGVKDGKLFTTASPCELCSKKAYQLGIKVIYYVDPYPGISQKQILEAGSKLRNPEVRLFNGVIGNAYHWLYEPFMSYKDEQSLILGHSIKDLTSKQKSALEHAVESLKLKDEKIKELEARLAQRTNETSE